MADEKFCTNCHYTGKSRRITKGSIFIELVLWIMFIVPGLIYSIWRLSSKYQACPKCGAPHMIPVGSPAAQRILSPPPAVETRPTKAQKPAPNPYGDEEDDRPNVYVIEP